MGTGSVPRLAANVDVVVIDDEELFRSAMNRLLRGYRVLALGDPRDALRRFRSGLNPRVVLCDVTMPAMSGVELCEEVARLDAELASRFVFVTGDAFMPRTRERLARLPNERLEKPFSKDRLLGVVQRMVAKGSREST